MFRSIFLCLLALTSTAAADDTCHGALPCALGERSYHVMAPDGWDGVSPLPVLMHFHGWGRTGVHAQNSERIGASTKRRGVLLVTPNGAGKTWDFWGKDTADVSFGDAVLADVAKRYPVAEDQIYVSGYSYGAAMAWRYACHSGEDVAALLAIAGSISQGETCDEAPQQVRHVHGVEDTVATLPIGAGDDLPLGLWRARLRCAEATPQGDWQARSFLTLTRSHWTCANGSVTLDLHPGGHFVPHGWIGRQLDQLLGLTPSYP